MLEELYVFCKTFKSEGMALANSLSDNSIPDSTPK